MTAVAFKKLRSAGEATPEALGYCMHFKLTRLLKITATTLMTMVTSGSPAIGDQLRADGQDHRKDQRPQPLVGIKERCSTGAKPPEP